MSELHEATGVTRRGALGFTGLGLAGASLAAGLGTAQAQETIASTTGMVDDNGVPLWFQTTGRGEPLVLTGGFGLLHDQWHYIRPILAKNYTVIDWHYRGNGLSDRSWPGTHTFERWVDDLKVVLDHLKVKRCHLWGTSTGAKLSIRFASRFPKMAQSLITYPSFRGGGRAPNDPFIALGARFGYEALGRMYQWYGCAEENKWNMRGNEIAQFEAASFSRNFSLANFAETLDIFGRADLTADLGRMKLPMLLLLGESGTLGSARPNMQNTIAEVRKLCPQAELKTIPKAGGTYCVIEEPQATADAALEFLQRHPIKRA
ncbi:MAG: alpha/beta hydrolase [Rhodospirillaceae bacterium]|nr:alpha/beta hydrolase [Rhodospirillaceae bacterium]